MDEDRYIDMFIFVGIAIVIALKLMNVIQVSWLWLTEIIWIPLLIGLVIAICLLIMFGFELLKNKRRLK